MDFKNGKELLDLCRENEMNISDVMYRREVTEGDLPTDDVTYKMKASLDVMKRAASLSIETPLESTGGLIGGGAKKFADSACRICGPILTDAISYAMSVLEVNASMGLIVAAPTAGSSGVVPGCLLALEKHEDLSEDDLIAGLFNASAIGYLFMRNASVSGAEGGCQAEVGAASAMAASAMTELLGGTPEMCLDAAAFAISNILGMVCDPIAGLVESPCQSRNAIGAANAFTAAQLSMAGIRHLIPFDEMVDCLDEVGRQLPKELRETALGGCACTPTACDLSCSIFGE